jgi:uncharacterized RDD family membrane protein YckC
VEALLLSTLGYTPGKWLLKVKVRDINGKKLTYIRALKRGVFVFIFGLGCCIPIFILPALAVAYYQLAYHKITLWDKHGNFVVTHSPIGVFRTIIAIVFIMISVGIPCLLDLLGI